jgi:ribosomal protein S18 acetylase RimI-like enzyme
VADALVTAVVRWAESRGFHRLLLDVADENVAAVRFYERMGFRRNGRIGSLPPPREHVREHQRELLL